MKPCQNKDNAVGKYNGLGVVLTGLSRPRSPLSRCESSSRSSSCLVPVVVSLLLCLLLCVAVRGGRGDRLTGRMDTRIGSVCTKSPLLIKLVSRVVSVKLCRS